MIKKFQIELLVLLVLILNIFISYNIDIGFYNFFKDFNESLKNTYLKEFFEEVTVLGDSKWYFSVSVMVLLSCFFFKKNNFFNKFYSNLTIIRNFSCFLLLALFITGLITQILKHVVGRPRPNHTTFSDNFGFNFFSLDSSFHSFPSGHTSTIFLVALVFSLILPRLKYFFIFFASVVAFSRVVVGAHFFTDIAGGIAVSYIGLKISLLILKKFYPNLKLNSQENLNQNNIYLFFIVSFLFVVFFTLGPTIDIYISGLFYYGNNQFLLQSYYDITVFFRKIILRGIVIYVLLIPILSMFLPLKSLFHNYVFKTKDVVFLWGSSIFNIIIIVNLLLKDFWGRARPGEILQLDGKEFFTPWYLMSEACEKNCSFVSGDAAVGFSLIVFYFLTKKEIYFWLSVFFGGSLGLVRIMEGGHFFSDVVMAGTIVFISYFFFYKYFYLRDKNV